MKLICNGIDLADAFSKVSKALTGKTAISILEGVKITAYGDKLTLFASDTEITIENSINANIMLEGEILVPGKLTAELVRKMSSEQIELEALGDNVLNIKYLDSCSKINLMNVEEYPNLNISSFSNNFIILKKDLKDLVLKTNFAVATDDNRPAIKGCLLEIEDDRITCVALDGLRIALCKKTLNTIYKDMKFLILGKYLNEVSKLIEDDEGIVKVYGNKQKILFDIGNTKITVSLIELDFIPYKKIITNERKTNITVQIRQLQECIERITIFSRNNGANMVTLDAADNILKLYSKSEIGDITERINVSINGNDNKVALNAKYIADCLRVIDDEYANITINSSVLPCIITPIEGDNYLYLLLPVRQMS